MKNKFYELLILSLVFFLFSCANSDSNKLSSVEDENKFLDELNLSGRAPVRTEEAEKKSVSELISAEIVKASEQPAPEYNLDLPQDDKKTEEEKPRKEPFYVEMNGELAEQQIPVTINFDSTPIAGVVRVFASILKFDYLIDPQVSGNVSIAISNSKMSVVDVWKIFEHILWLSGAYISPESGIVHIMPFSKMPAEKKLLVDHSPHPNVEVMMLNIKNTASKDILEKLKPFLTAGSTAIDIPHQNSILLIETPANSEKIKGLVQLLDKKNKANWPQTIIKCVNVSSDRIRDELLTIMPILGFPISSENVQSEPGAIQIASLERLQVIIASAANQEALNELRRWAAILDKSDVGEQEQVFIYKVLNGKADELLSAISVIFPVEGTTLAVTTSDSATSASTTGTMSGALTASGTTSPTVTNTSQIRSPQTSGKKEAPASLFDVPVKVFADAVNNRLVIRTTPRTYVMLRAILERLDTVAAQVLLQVMVSEVTLTKDTEFGVEFSTAAQQKGNYDSIFASNLRDLNPGVTNEYGLRYWVFKDSDPNNKFAYLRALAGNGRIKVLSCPQVVVKSHSEAKIAVGDKVPIVTSENTDTSSNTVINRSIEYQDTGVILTIRPHVTEGGLITIELEQTVSQPFRNNTSEIDSPIIQERLVKTALAIRDGGTIIVGGLIRERSEDANTSYPFIQEIPLLRRLVGHNNLSSTRTEMLVLITGRVINEYSRLEDITRRYRQAILALQDLDGKNE